MSSSSWKDLQNRRQVCCRQTRLYHMGANVDYHTLLAFVLAWLTIKLFTMQTGMHNVSTD